LEEFQRTGDSTRQSLASAPGSLERSSVLRLDDVGTSLSRIGASLTSVLQAIINDESIRRIFVGLADFTEFLTRITTGLGSLGSVVTKLTAGFVALSAIVASRQFLQGFAGEIRRGNGGIIAPTIGGVRSVRNARGKFLTGGNIAAAAAIGGGLALGDSSDPLASGLGTILQFAGGGALAGSAFGPGVGTAVGAGAGTLLGAILTVNESIKNNTKAQEEALRERFAKSDVAGRSQILKDILFPQRREDTFEFNGVTPVTTANSSRLVNSNFLLADIEKNLKNSANKELFETFLSDQIDVAKKRVANILSGTTGISVEDQNNAIIEELSRLLSENNVFPNRQIASNFLRQRKANNALPNFAVRPSEASTDFVLEELRSKNDILNSVLNNLITSFTSFNDRLEVTNQQLANIITNPSSVLSANLSSPQLRANVLVNRDRAFTSNLQEFLSPDNINSIRAFALNRGTGSSSELDSPTLIGTLEKVFDIESNTFQDIVGKYGLTLENLSAISGKSFGEILVDLVNFRGSLSKFVDDITGTSQTIDAITAAYQNTINVFNQRLQIERQLADNALTLSQAFFDVSKQIQGIQNTQQSRSLGQSLFLSRTSGPRASILESNLLLGNARSSSFGSSSSFITNFLQSVRDRNSAITNAQQSNFDGRIDFNAFEKANSAQITNNRLQQELTQRLSELGLRVDNAAQAADILRQAFIELEASFESAGSGIRQFSGNELRKSFDVFTRFVNAGGVNNPIAGIRGFNTKDFGSL
ncbi:MAG: hypothetical protein EBR67_10340, partial [Proteobacteria bacterium]|nr:hypothetical protein [Pseudomonadota bacterium]